MPYYYVDEMTREIAGPFEPMVIPGIGAQIPSNAIELPEQSLPVEAGHAWVWRDGQAVQLLDMRGLVYRKDNGLPFHWNEFGTLPDDLTVKPRPNYCFWKDDDWVLDVEAERAGQAAEADVARDNQLRTVVIRVAPLQYAYELGEATSEQLSALQAWKRYALNLARIDLQPGYPAIIEWPAAPAQSVVTPAL
ncbi:tail fiber assembly protein [Pseudomonas sp. H1h]|uniref:tail fiber assembly protein n=1 Tax=Pseudomonas sp. H1h TaxID=1397280 RepID=UPI0004683BCB|nr:tail fiber assembly protein [Pseudomonas sp. H1h]